MTAIVQIKSSEGDPAHMGLKFHVHVLGHFLLAVQPWPAVADLATQKDTHTHTHTHTSSADLCFLSDSDTHLKRERDLSPLRPLQNPLINFCPSHCSFRTWAWPPGTVAEWTAASWTGALLDKRHTFFAMEAPTTAKDWIFSSMQNVPTEAPRMCVQGWNVVHSFLKSYYNHLLMENFTYSALLKMTKKGRDSVRKLKKEEDKNQTQKENRLCNW